jgi:hypothetical protein
MNSKAHSLLCISGLISGPMPNDRAQTCGQFLVPKVRPDLDLDTFVGKKGRSSGSIDEDVVMPFSPD